MSVKRILSVFIALLTVISFSGCDKTLSDKQLDSITEEVFEGFNKTQSYKKNFYGEVEKINSKNPDEPCSVQKVAYNDDKRNSFEYGVVLNNKTQARYFADGELYYVYAIEDDMSIDGCFEASLHDIDDFCNESMKNIRKLISEDKDYKAEWKAVELKSDKELDFEISITFSEDAFSSINDVTKTYTKCVIKALSSKDGSEISGMSFEMVYEQKTNDTENSINTIKQTGYIGNDEILKEYYDFSDYDEIKELYKSYDHKAKI